MVFCRESDTANIHLTCAAGRGRFATGSPGWHALARVDFEHEPAR